MTSTGLRPRFLLGVRMPVEFWYFGFFLWGIVCASVAIKGLSS